MPPLSSSAPAVPLPPWPAGDERGMGNTQGPATWWRAAVHLSAPGAKCYELAHAVTNTIPQSPMCNPLKFSPRPTRGIRGSYHVSNMETLTGDQGGQSTHIDALGHFGVSPVKWDGSSELPMEEVTYYGGYTQAQVKPEPSSMLQHLGIDKAPPIITSAVLLDAKAHMGKGRTLEPGTVITAADIEQMLIAQGLAERGILPGDVLYIHTGWGADHWGKPVEDNVYYTMGPGLGCDAARYIADRAVVLVALDNPFTDAVNSGQLAGKASSANGYPDGLPFAIHHHCLVEAGIHQIQNAKLDELAKDQVWQSCTFVLPLRIQGAVGSMVRPVAIGVPGQGK